MSYLIDGYNLLYAMGVLRGRVGPAGLEKARLSLLGLLSSSFKEEEAGQVTIVFDAAHAPPGAADVRDYHGIHVRFAVRQKQADDLIESLIEHDSAPRRLTVVSNDHRIQQAGRRRQCNVQGCADFLDWLLSHRKEIRAHPTPESLKPERPTEKETEYWTKVFANLQNDPELKALSEPDEWLEEGP